MTEFTQLKAKYLGHEKNPFHQFSQLMSATTDLPGAVSDDNVKYAGLLKDLQSSSNRSAPREVLIFRILSELQKTGNKNWRNEYLKFLSDLKRSRYWIEDSLSDFRQASEVENTIFFPQPHHFNDTVIAQKFDEHAKMRIFQSSEEKFTSRLLLLNSKLSKDGRPAIFWHLLMKPSLLNALSEIDYEITDNAYWHALKTDANANYQETLDEGFFGDILYLQIHSFSRIKASKAKIGNKWPVDLRDYVSQYSEYFCKDSVRFIITSYVDNGPGILQHVHRFPKKDASIPSSISDIIERKITTRDVPEAGEGLSNVLQAIYDLNGLLILTSGNRRFVFSGLKGDKSEHPISNSRGTMITIITPV